MTRANCSGAPEISFIIPAFNAEAYLEHAVRSAAAQTVENVEIIIIDDASSDGTVELGEQLAHNDARIKVLRSEVNRGPSAARNRGMDEARGKWIAVLDADDEILPNRSEVLLGIAAASSAHIIADNLMLVREETKSATTGLARNATSGGYLLSISTEMYLRKNCILKDEFPLGYLKPMYKVSFLKEHGIRYDESIRIAEDFDFCLRALLSGARFIVSSEPLYTYRIRAGSLSSRLVQSDVRRLIERSEGLRTELDLQDPGLREAFAVYEHYLQRALAFSSFVDRLKASRFLEALRIAAQTPSMLGLVAQNGPVALRKRIQRVGRRFNSRAQH